MKNSRPTALRDYPTALREFGVSLDGHDLLPDLTDDGAIRLEESESELWRGTALVHCFRDVRGLNTRTLWTTRSPSEVVVTNQRVAFACSDFIEGGGYTSFGMAPISTTLLNIASRVRVRRTTGMLALVGQVSWAWPFAVDGRSKANPDNSGSVSLVRILSMAYERSGSTIWMGLWDVLPNWQEALDAMLAGIAEWRLSHRKDLSAEDAVALRSLKSCPGDRSEERRHLVPGWLFMPMMTADKPNPVDTESVIRTGEETCFVGYTSLSVEDVLDTANDSVAGRHLQMSMKNIGAAKTAVQERTANGVYVQVDMIGGGELATLLVEARQSKLREGQSVVAVHILEASMSRVVGPFGVPLTKESLPGEGFIDAYLRSFGASLKGKDRDAEIEYHF